MGFLRGSYGESDLDVPLFGRLRTSSAWGVFDFRCEGTSSPKDSEAAARQRFSQQEILHGVARTGGVFFGYPMECGELNGAKPAIGENGFAD